MKLSFRQNKQSTIQILIRDNEYVNLTEKMLLDLISELCPGIHYKFLDTDKNNEVSVYCGHHKFWNKIVPNEFLGENDDVTVFTEQLINCVKDLRAWLGSLKSSHQTIEL